MSAPQRALNEIDWNGSMTRQMRRIARWTECFFGELGTAAHLAMRLTRLGLLLRFRPF